MWHEALNGHGGGIFGLFAWVLKTYLGGLASTVILAGLILISILLIFNTAIVSFVLLHKKIFATTGTVGQTILKGIRLLFVPTKSDETNSNYEDSSNFSLDKEDEEELADQKRHFLSKNIKENRREEEAETEDGESDTNPKPKTITDFNHEEKLTPEQIGKVEQIVNEVISKNIEIEMME